MDADFDLDVIDHAEDDEYDEEEAAHAPRGASGGHRGPDIQWKEVMRWQDETEFNNSEEYGLLKEFTKKKSWMSDYADSETWACKYSRKAHFRKCPRMVKLEYLGASKTVIMLDNSQEHDHTIDADYGGGKKYCWTPVQEGIVLPLARSRATATVVDRELRRQGAVDSQGNYPTLGQINTKKNYMFKTQVMKDLVMLDTADLRMAIEERSAVPEDPHQAFICSYTIDDSDPGGKPRFSVTFTTRHLLLRINKIFIQNDATYKLVWMGYPVFTSGTSTSSGRFFLTHTTLSTHEDTAAWATIFRMVLKYTDGQVPRFQMADGAWEITNAGREVFGEVGTRLMCWSHVHRNVKPKLAGIRKINKALGEAILTHIEDIQWMAQSEQEFTVLCDQLKQHYTRKKLSDTERTLVKAFLDYFLVQWGPGSHAMNWFAGAHPFSITNNQGQEGYHKEVKRNHTFRSELPLGQFFQAMEQLVSEHSKRDDSLLTKPRTAILYDLDNTGKRPKDSLRILTNGHVYYREFLRKPKPGDWLEVKPTGLSTLSDRADVQMGRVVAIHALRTSSNPMPEQSLKVLARLRLKLRADPSSITSLTSYLDIRSSCWLIEELEDGQFNCDCRKGFKGKNCCHELALSYKKERIEVLPHAEALKLGERRKRGRPKKINMERPREERVVEGEAQGGEEVFSEDEEQEYQDEGGDQIFLAHDEEPLRPAAELLPAVQPILHAAEPLLAAVQPLLPAVQEVPQPAEKAPQAAEEAPQAAEKAPQPAEKANQPAEEAPQPAENAPQPAKDAAQPADKAPQPAEKAPQPAKEAPQPAKEAPQPAKEAPQPAEEAPQPAAQEILQPAAKKPVELKKRRGRCGDCSGCQANDCKNCKYCKNKALKKACILKTCLKKKPTSPAPPKGTGRRTKKILFSASSSSKASASAKRKRISPPSSANTSPVLKPASSRARLSPSSTPITRRVTRRTAGAK